MKVLLKDLLIASHFNTVFFQDFDYYLQFVIVLLHTFQGIIITLLFPLLPFYFRFITTLLLSCNTKF